MRHANVLILTDETEFARLLTACWQAERQAPSITVISSELWRSQDVPRHDLVVVGPLREGKLANVLSSLDPATAAILCVPADSREFGPLRAKYPRLVHIPLREDWAQTLLLVAGESLRRRSPAAGTPGGTKRRQKREPRDARTLHAGNETQRKQRADFHAGERGTPAARTRAAFFAVAGADQDDSQHGIADQRGDAAILIAGYGDEGG